jgi:protein-S-isoprenylcysteine O-methyltransferase Ste14
MSNNIQNSADNPGVVAPPPLIYGIPLLAGLLLHVASPRKFLPFSAIARILGAICIGTGIATVSAGFRTMRQAGTNIDPRQPATTVVTSGPFRFTRNPLYLSLALLYSGIALFLNSAWPMFFLPFVLTIMNRGVIDREEHYLEGKFGPEYLNYKTQVRRWL